MTAEFSRRTEGLLDRAEAICERRGANLTELRRHVLGLVLDAASPTGAYELLDRLRQTRRGAAPPTDLSCAGFPAGSGPDPPGRAAIGVRRLRCGLHRRHRWQEPYARCAVPDLPRLRQGDRNAGPPRLCGPCACCERCRFQHQQCDDRGRGAVQHMPYFGHGGGGCYRITFMPRLAASHSQQKALSVRPRIAVTWRRAVLASEGERRPDE